MVASLSRCSCAGVEEENEVEEGEEDDDDMTVEEEGADFEGVDEDEFEHSQSSPPLNKIELSEVSVSCAWKSGEWG